MDESKCKEMIWEGFHQHQCRKNIWKDGYCKIHHPESVKIRDEKKHKRWEEKRQSSPWYRLEEALKRIKELEKLLEEKDDEIKRLNYWKSGIITKMVW